jgi:ubiquinone/menaquinone biosynthesis C-methylase UbiE
LTDAAVANVRTRFELEGLEADVQRGDAESIPFDDGTFDLVYSWGVLQHTPDTARAVAEVRRVTKPDGQARIMLYGRHSWVALGLWARYELLAGRPLTSLGESVARHMQGPRVKSYTEYEIRELLSPHFRQLEFRRYLTPYDRRVGGPIAAALGDRAGWFIGVIAHV